MKEAHFSTGWHDSNTVPILIQYTMYCNYIPRAATNKSLATTAPQVHYWPLMSNILGVNQGAHLYTTMKQKTVVPFKHSSYV